MSFERSYSIEYHERIKLILIFGDKSLLLTWWVTYQVHDHYHWSETHSGTGNRLEGRLGMKGVVSLGCNYVLFQASVCK